MNKYTRRCCISLTIREMNIKTRRRHHLPSPVRMAVFKIQEITDLGEDVEKRDPL